MGPQLDKPLPTYTDTGTQNLEFPRLLSDALLNTVSKIVGSTPEYPAVFNDPSSPVYVRGAPFRVCMTCAKCASETAFMKRFPSIKLDLEPNATLVIRPRAYLMLPVFDFGPLAKKVFPKPTVCFRIGELANNNTAAIGHAGMAGNLIQVGAHHRLC